jgi:hypothetical protein
MPADGVREDHDARAEVADQFDHDLPGFVRVEQPRVRQPGVAPFRDAHQGRRADRLFGAQAARAMRARLAPREIYDAGPVALFGRLDQRAAAGQFDVIGVGAEGGDRRSWPAGRRPAVATEAAIGAGAAIGVTDRPALLSP